MSDLRTPPQRGNSPADPHAAEARPPVFESKESPSGPIKSSGPTMALVNTGQISSDGNPLFALQFFQEGRLVGQFRMVSRQPSDPQSNKSLDISSSRTPKAADVVSQDGAASAISSVRTGAGGARWFIEAHTAQQESQCGCSAHGKLPTPKQDDEGGARGVIEVQNQVSNGMIRNWIANQRNEEATKASPDIQ